MVSGDKVNQISTKESSSTTRGVKPGYKRHTFIVDEEILEDLFDVAFQQRMNIQDVVEEAFSSYLYKRVRKKKRKK